jgi:hypothetical protein
MEVIAGSHERRPIVASAVVLSALAILGFVVFKGYRVLDVAVLVTIIATAAVAYRSLLQWRMLLAAIIVVILFIPIRRYHLPASLPFDLEPYRLIVAIVLIGWLTSLLIDPRVRLRRSAFDGPLVLITFAVLASVLLNPHRVSGMGANVAKSLTFFLSFVLLFCLIVSVTRSLPTVTTLAKLMVVGGTILAVLALVERRTGYNVFNQLGGIVPLLRFEGAIEEEGLLRGVRLRVVGPAEHPIALGAVFVMLIPLAVYLVRATRRMFWWLAAGLLLLAAVATASRTAIIMLLVVGLVYLWLRPRETKRLWPALLPAVLLIHFALPGAIGTIRGAFFPEGGLIEEQSRVIEGNELRSNGRIADIAPTLREVAPQPFFGQGFGTRIVGFEVEDVNSAILDDQWLGTLLETGVVGVLGWAWLFWRAIRRLAHAAQEDESPAGWLMAGFAASLAAFAVGMFTYDAFGFIQVTFVFFILLALGAAVLQIRQQSVATTGRAA